MSMTVSAYIIEPNKDEFEWTGYGSNLLHDLVFGQMGDMLQSYLSSDDFQFLQPVYWPDPGKVLDEARDPVLLKTVIQKIAIILKTYSEDFPLAHMVVDKEEDGKPIWMSGSTSWEDDAGRRWTLGAFHHSLEHRDEVQVRIRDGEEESYWIPAKEVADVGGRQIKIHSETWFEHCQGDIQAVIEICEKAIRLGKPILWAYS